MDCGLSCFVPRSLTPRRCNFNSRCVSSSPQARTKILRQSRNNQSRQATGSYYHVHRRRHVLHPIFLRVKHVKECHRRGNGSTSHTTLVETPGEISKFENDEGQIGSDTGGGGNGGGCGGPFQSIHCTQTEETTRVPNDGDANRPDDGGCCQVGYGKGDGIDGEIVVCRVPSGTNSSF